MSQNNTSIKATNASKLAVVPEDEESKNFVSFS